MKTTLEISDDLFIEAKSIAARRRVTLRSIIEHALRREIHPEESVPLQSDNFMNIGRDGMPALKRRGVSVTSKKIRQIIEDEGI